MNVSVSPALQSIVRLGIVAFADLRLVEAERRLDAPLAETEARVRVHPPEDRAAVRAMYRSIGLDPTKRRPSSEALLRRVRRGDPLPRINTLVDICNWCSLEFQLPYGLYDLDRIEGDVELRLGREREAYAGIRKDEVHVAGRMTLADAVGPFGNPTSDSARTMVTTTTTSALMVVFSPLAVDTGSLERVLGISSARTTGFCGGRELSRRII